MCGCRKRTTNQYVWSNDDGTEIITYSQEIQAKAKVIRAGGSYLSLVNGQPQPVKTV